MTISGRDTFARMREACRQDPGAFHGAIAKRQICWFLPDQNAWAFYDEAQGGWRGWSATDASPLSLDLPESFDPWDRSFNDDTPPHWRWFEGGLTNAAFNEVDRHVLDGFGEEAALIFEGDRWNMASDGGRGGPVDAETVSRKKLMLESAKCTLALQALGLKPGDRIALNMPSIPEQIYWTEGAKRMGVVYTPV
ncbi:MAG: acetyl-coenzyme A synthetase N-terminal domain-containing protein, partial [Pseudomonadota bacterium]